MRYSPAARPNNLIGSTAAPTTTGAEPLLTPPAVTRSARAAVVLVDRWHALRNDLRLTIQHHMIAAPAIALTVGFIAGRILNAAFARRDS